MPATAAVAIGQAAVASSPSPIATRMTAAAMLDSATSRTPTMSVIHSAVFDESSDGIHEGFASRARATISRCSSPGSRFSSVSAF